ncbi:lens fiber membrane intrinsic protein-like [Elysia marginata]|uniref:Lens fiber membrane intrinsic protein-like n=1 Tax=Elysia marginata TaxID=1093978 RepID=A0AAV4H864_9GAST|nr:lens fiber membrane intrinsic protein-like [Elysia marginata]
MAVKLVPLIAFCVLGLGVVLHIIGLSTPHWITQTVDLDEETVDVSAGLWQVCVGGLCNSIHENAKHDWYRACGAMAIIGMLSGMISALMVGVVFVMGLMNKDSGKTKKATSILSFLAAVFSVIMILICVIIFAVKTNQEGGYDFGYSFFLSTAGAVVIVIGGNLALVGMFV